MTKRSLVLITVDCLRADHVGVQRYSQSVTPFLDSLAKNSVVFSDAIVAGAPTYFSFPAILASRYPLGLGRDILGIAPNEPTIATALRDAGYRTAAFIAGNPYLSSRFGYHHGFDEFHDLLDATPYGESQRVIQANKGLSNLNRRLEAASRFTLLTASLYNEVYFRYCQWRSARQGLSLDQLRRYPAAHVVIDQACSWLSELRDGHVFLWVHLMDPHHPYYPPLEAQSELGASHVSARRARFLNAFWDRGDIAVKRLRRHREEILSLYDAGVYWVDKQISRLVDFLRQSNRWDETVFAVTADHGEEFLENGNRYHSPTSLSEQLIHVPLIIRTPESSGVRISQSAFSLVHLAPTLLEAVGTAIPESFQGQSRWKQVVTGNPQAEPAIAECIEGCTNPDQVENRIRPRLLAIRDRQYKLVIRFSDRTDFLYDLENDPGEQSPLPTGVLTGERVRLLQAALAHLERTRRNRSADLALRARLCELRHSLGSKREPTAPALVSG